MGTLALPSIVSWEKLEGEEDEICLEWFDGDRRLTAYVGSEGTKVLMSDSPRVEEMRYESLAEAGGWGACMKWLRGGA